MKALTKWLFQTCDHPDIRGVHGDEIKSTAKGIFWTKFARARCAICEKYLYNHDLPLVCTMTKKAHFTTPRRNK